MAALLRRRAFSFSVSVTTRARRPSEEEGVHYRFVDEDAFHEMIADGELLEWARYGPHLYGTPRRPVEEALARGEDVVLEIEIQGARQVRSAYPAALLVFIAPPDMDELERRLRGRGDTDDSAIRTRMDIAREELESASSVFDLTVLNDDVERAANRIERFLEEHGSRGADGSVYADPAPRPGEPPGIHEVQTE